MLGQMDYNLESLNDKIDALCVCPSFQNLSELPAYEMTDCSGQIKGGPTEVGKREIRDCQLDISSELPPRTE